LYCICGKIKDTGKGIHTHKKFKQRRLLFYVQGDYETQIKAFGIKKFLKLIDDYDVLEDGLRQLMNTPLE